MADIDFKNLRQNPDGTWNADVEIEGREVTCLLGISEDQLSDSNSFMSRLRDKARSIRVDAAIEACEQFGADISAKSLSDEIYLSVVAYYGSGENAELGFLGGEKLLDGQTVNATITSDIQLVEASLSYE